MRTLTYPGSSRWYVYDSSFRLWNVSVFDIKISDTKITLVIVSSNYKAMIVPQFEVDLLISD